VDRATSLTWLRSVPKPVPWTALFKQIQRYCLRKPPLCAYTYRST